LRLLALFRGHVLAKFGNGVNCLPSSIRNRTHCFSRSLSNSGNGFAYYCGSLSSKFNNRRRLIAW
jgi:hypothetical protein